MNLSLPRQFGLRIADSHAARRAAAISSTKISEFKVLWSCIAMAMACACADAMPLTGAGATTADSQTGADAALVDDRGSDRTAADGDRDAGDTLESATTAAALIGTWLDCFGNLVLGADGTFEWAAAESGCQIRGGWTVVGAKVTFVPTTVGAACDKPPSWLKTGVGASVAEGVLTLSDLSMFGGGHRFGKQGSDRAEVLRERWLLQATAGTATMDLCFTANGMFFNGKFTSPGCAVLACAGVVGQVSKVGTQTHIWTQCAGQCPCAGVVVAQIKTAAHMSGTYSAAHCGSSQYGEFSAKIGVFPVVAP
ncbi:MAG: hypothetical protein EXR77_02480 [Myxococcales bacterium]|nr:hypothetical protein [Myxococcales bacterium]